MQSTDRTFIMAACNVSMVANSSRARCVPGHTFGCRATGSQGVWVSHGCTGWFVRNGLERYVCSAGDRCTLMGFGSEAHEIKPGNEAARTLATLTAHPILTLDLLALLQARPEFAGVSLVHIDPSSHQPQLLSKIVQSVEPSGRPKRPVYFVYNPSILDASNWFVKVSSFAHCSIGSRNFTLRNRVHNGARWVVWLHRSTVRMVIANAEDPSALRIGGRIHMLFTRRRGHSSAMHLARLEPQFHDVALNYSRAGPPRTLPYL